MEMFLYILIGIICLPLVAWLLCLALAGLSVIIIFPLLLLSGAKLEFTLRSEEKKE